MFEGVQDLSEHRHSCSSSNEALPDSLRILDSDNLVNNLSNLELESKSQLSERSKPLLEQELQQQVSSTQVCSFCSTSVTASEIASMCLSVSFTF
jgi:hypothetical protein